MLRRATTLATVSSTRLTRSVSEGHFELTSRLHRPSPSPRWVLIASSHPTAYPSSRGGWVQTRGLMIPRSPASPSPQSSDRPRDEKIRSFTIILKDAAGNLGEEISLWQMFQRYDQKTHTLVQLAPPQDDKPAICQLLTLSDYYKQQVRTPRRERNPASVLKQLEMSWSIDPHDLRLRLDKLQDFLAAGHRVELTLATKKRTAPIAPQKAQEVMAAIEARIEEIEGAHEGRPRFGTLGRYMVLVLEGKKIGGPKSRPERRERRPPKPQRDRAEYLSEEQLAKLKG